MPIAENIKRGITRSNYATKSAEESQILQNNYGKEQVFDLSVSNTLMAPPPEFVEVLKNFVELPQPGKHRYMENAGFMANRSMVAERLKLETGLNFSSDNVIMTCGSSGALNIIFKGIFNPGEELIVFSPFYPEYVPYLENYSGVCKVIPTNDDFTPDLKALETAITPETKAIIINSPNNPTGLVYSAETLKGIADVLSRRGTELNTTIYAVSDETYSRLIFDGITYPHMFNHYVNTIALSSYSSELCIPGERIGYAAIHPDCEGGKEVSAALIHTNRTLGFVNCPALIQNVVRRLPETLVYLKDYQRKRNFLFGKLVGLGYKVVKPAGGFFMLVKSPTRDDKAFVTELKKQLVLTVAGSEFQAPGYFRISYCVDDKTLERAVAVFQRALVDNK